MSVDPRVMTADSAGGVSPENDGISFRGPRCGTAYSCVGGLEARALRPWDENVNVLIDKGQS